MPSTARTRSRLRGIVLCCLCSLPLGCDRIKEVFAGEDKEKTETAPATEAKPTEPAPDAPPVAAAPPSSVVPSTTAAPVEVVEGEVPAVGTGRFVWKYRPAKNELYKPYEALFEHARLPAIVEMMGMFALERNVPVATLECGQPNAFYNSEKHGVVLCYELAHLFYESFRAQGADDQQASDRTLNALTFVLLHEMGHGVIGELELGVTGGEEDAVDDLAAVLLIDAKQPAWAIDGAVSMALLGAGSKPKFFDEHSLGEQRFYNIACIVYGSDPARYVGLVADGVLPRERSVRCPKEYAQKDKAWAGMLGPHMHK